MGRLCRDCWRRSGFSSDWEGLVDGVKTYWRVYGGRRAIVRSPAALGAAVLATLAAPIWWSNSSAETALAIIPNLLGFSIGAMAIVLAFPTTEMFEVIAEDGREDSYYLDLAARLVHFIFVQVLTLISGIVTLAFPNFIFSYVTLFLLVYAILTAALTALALFEVAIFYNKSKKPK